MRVLSSCGIRTLGLLALASASALAHVPYLEIFDFSENLPHVIKGPITQSRAVYAWLRSGSDLDVYRFALAEPTRVRIEMLVPVCESYEDFRPHFAIVGPGLPEPSTPLPFALAEGCGALVCSPGSDERATFYEPFGGKSYYQGQRCEPELVPGEYHVYVWSPSGARGDYVAVFGDEEVWGFVDIIRALIFTPLIRWDFELHAPRASGVGLGPIPRKETLEPRGGLG